MSIFQKFVKVTLDLSKGKVLLHFVFTKQKLGMFSFIMSYLKSKLEMI